MCHSHHILLPCITVQENITKIFIFKLLTLKKKIENNSILKGAFFLGEKRTETSELKLTQTELFSLFRSKSVATSVSELFCVPLQSNNERFSCHSKISF